MMAGSGSGGRYDISQYDADRLATQLALGVRSAQVAPSPPSSVIATARNAAAEVQFLITKAGAATSFVITASPGGAQAAVTPDPVFGGKATGVVSGLTNGTPYTFTVVAVNAAGSSRASAASNSVTPTALPSTILPVTRALEFWWSSAQVASPPADGAAVTSLLDMSGNGGTAAGAGTGSGGTWKASWSGGKPAVQLAGLNQRFDTLASGLLAGMRSPKATIYAVWTATANPNAAGAHSGRVISQEVNNLIDTSIALGVGATASQINPQVFCDSYGGSAATITGATVALSTPIVSTLTAPGGLRTNGVAETGITNPVTKNGNPWTIGNIYANQFNRGLQGYLAELAIFYDVHTPSEIALMETYLATRY